MEPSLLTRIAKGAGWVIAWRLGMRILGLISTLVLVRLLAPEDFGLIALATGFAQTIEGMMAIGADEAVIRERDPGRDIYDTAFTLNLLRGIAVAALVALAAHPAASFFNEPRLVPILYFIALLPLLDGLGNTGTVEFRRDLTFQKEFAIMVLPKLGGILAAIACAFLLQTYVAMLAGMGVNRSLRLVMSYAMHPYRPRLSLRAARRMIGYSFWTWMFGLAALIRDKADTIMLGRMMGSASVGFYAVGAEIAALPTTELIEPLGRSAFSGFALERRGGGESGTLFLRLLGLAALIVLPAGFGLSLVAGSLVPVALGPGWEAAIPVLQVLSLTGAMTVFGQIGLHLISAHGLLGRLAGVTILGAALRIGLLAALIPSHGLTGAAWAVGAAICAEQALLLVLALRRFAIGFGDFAIAVWRPAGATLVMAAVLSGTGLGWVQSPASGTPVALVTGVTAGALIYLCTLFAMWFSSGRPIGPEYDCITALRRIYQRATHNG